ncbi:hypothetical protein ACSHWB_31935 [Lentzea sp. HUAS TT2]|uniref:hypothetical protein n=1 Tax=Lentzea sp. HUAS TT2 TaxID=3447454 RepID=UPI003F71113B
MQVGDRFEALTGSDSDLFAAVQDAQVGVFDDDGDQLAAVTRPELDPLAAGQDASAGMDSSLGA